MRNVSAATAATAQVFCPRSGLLLVQELPATEQFVLHCFAPNSTLLQDIQRTQTKTFIVLSAVMRDFGLRSGGIGVDFGVRSSSLCLWMSTFSMRTQANKKAENRALTRGLGCAESQCQWL